VCFESTDVRQLSYSAVMGNCLSRAGTYVPGEPSGTSCNQICCTQDNSITSGLTSSGESSPSHVVGPWADSKVGLASESSSKRSFTRSTSKTSRASFCFGTRRPRSTVERQLHAAAAASCEVSFHTQQRTSKGAGELPLMP
jgi:hypothetical protein